MPDQPARALLQRHAGFGGMQAHGTAIHGMRTAADQAALLQPMQQANQVGRQDAQHIADVTRCHAGVVQDQRGDGEIHRTQVKGFHVLQKHTDSQQRNAASVVTEQGFQQTGIQCVVRLGTSSRHRTCNSRHAVVLTRWPGG